MLRAHLRRAGRFLLGDLYAPEGWLFVDSDLFSVWDLLTRVLPGRHAGQAPGGRPARALIAKVQAPGGRRRHAATTQGTWPARGLGVPLRQLAGGVPVRALHGRPQPAPTQPRLGDVRRPDDSTAPGFGPMWTWASAPCATNTWTVQDRDAYAGPFTHATATRCSSWATTGTRRRTTTERSTPRSCCPTAGCCTATAGGTRHTARRRASRAPSTATCSRSGCRPPERGASATSSRSPTRSGARWHAARRARRSCPRSCRRFREARPAADRPAQRWCAHVTLGLRGHTHVRMPAGQHPCSLRRV